MNYCFSHSGRQISERQRFTMIGIFFYKDGRFIIHKIPENEGEIRFKRRDDSYSHEKLYGETIKYGGYIDIPRGRVIWDIEKERSIIYIDACIEEVPGAINELVKIF